MLANTTKELLPVGPPSLPKPAWVWRSQNRNRNRKDSTLRVFCEQWCTTRGVQREGTPRPSMSKRCWTQRARQLSTRKILSYGNRSCLLRVLFANIEIEGWGWRLPDDGNLFAKSWKSPRKLLSIFTMMLVSMSDGCFRRDWNGLRSSLVPRRTLTRQRWFGLQDRRGYARKTIQ